MVPFMFIKKGASYQYCEDSSLYLSFLSSLSVASWMWETVCEWYMARLLGMNGNSERHVMMRLGSAHNKKMQTTILGPVNTLDVYDQLQRDRILSTNFETLIGKLHDLQFLTSLRQSSSGCNIHLCLWSWNLEVLIIWNIPYMPRIGVKKWMPKDMIYAFIFA